jgi:hypothetical protein
MNTDLQYMPIVRFRQEELKVLRHFHFGDHIYPCVEIIKDIDSSHTGVADKKKDKSNKPTSFEELVIPILWKIPSKKVFVDLPVHMKADKKVQEDVVRFLKGIVAKRSEKTKYLIKLKDIASKIIPVISTYSQITGEMDSIKLQEKDLRPHFTCLAYRTLPLTFENDLHQIEAIAQPQDFLIVDLNDYVADPEDEDIIPIVERLKAFKKCHITIVRSAMDHTITNVGLEPGQIVQEADNRLLNTYKQLCGNSFGDYAGIKKDRVNDGRGKSPGFIFYNPVNNDFYGFRGSVNKEGKSNQDLDDFENIIIPAVMKSEIIKVIQSSDLGFLNCNNRGWKILNDMHKRIDTKTKSPSKFKRIAIEHYLHCLRTKIDAGHFL